MKKVFFYICAASLFSQLIMMAILSRPELRGDEISYDSTAMNLISGKGFSWNGITPSVDRTPGYPFFLSGVYLIFGHSFIAVKIIQMVINSLTCIVIYLLARRVFGEKIAMYTAILAAVYPPLAAMSVHLYSEALFTLLFAFSILLLSIAIEKGGSITFLFSGLMLAFATLTRPTSAFFPPMLILLLPFFREKRKLILKGVLLCIAASAIALLPWILRNYLVFHEFIPFSNKGGIVLWTGSYIPGGGYHDNEITQKALIATIAKAQGVSFKQADLTDPAFREAVFSRVTPEVDRYLKKEALRNVIENPLGFIALIPLKIFRLWTGSYSAILDINIHFGDFFSNPDLWRTQFFILFVKSSIMLFSFLIFISACFGMYLARANWRGTILVLSTVIYFTVFHAIQDAHSRLGLPAVPFLMIYSVYSSVYMLKKLKLQIAPGVGRINRRLIN